MNNQPHPETFGKRLLCPRCMTSGKIHNIDHPQYDDYDNAMWYCEVCGGQWNHLIDATITGKPERFSCKRPKPELSPEEKQRLEEKLLKETSIDKSPISPDELTEILGSTVKQDDSNKVITALYLACNYSEEDQASVLFNAQSSAGKSYLPIELSQYLPEMDIITLGYCSPTAFFHDSGVEIADPSDNRDIEPEKKRKIIYVYLERKVIIFLDQPHPKLLENLRPLLSHDKKEITLKITDRSEKGGTRTKTVVVRGYPTVLFCTANYKMDEQERTRLLLLSPEVNQEKIREAIWLKIDKDSDREAYRQKLASDPKRQRLINRFAELKAQHIKQVYIPEELRQQVYNEFMANHKALQARQMRDIGRLLTLIKGYALLNFYQRNPKEVENEYLPYVEIVITATLEDVQVGFRYYNTISEANELGVAPEIYAIYKQFEDRFKQPNGLTFDDFNKAYYDLNKAFLNRGRATAYLKNLETAGLIVEQPDPDDKRRLRYVCLGVGVNSPNNLHPSTNIVLCSKVCANFDRPPCPHFTMPLPDDAEKPLKCHGYTPTGGFLNGL